MKKPPRDPSANPVSPRGSSPWDATRRAFLKASSLAVAGTLFRRGSTLAAGNVADSHLWPSDVVLGPVERLPANRSRTWIGSSFWSNRLQDWRLDNGWIKCLNGSARMGLRTAAVLTRELVDVAEPGFISVRMRRIEGTRGFGGFLIGTGAEGLPWQARALCHGMSGEGGGLLCTYESDGRVRFREHTDEDEPFAYAELPADRSGPPASTVAAEVSLRLALVPFGTESTCAYRPGIRSQAAA